MDNDDRDLASRLFALATAMLEDTLESAVAGQSADLSPAQLVEAGCQLRAAAGNIAAIAEAAMIAAERSADAPRDGGDADC